jgi:hypothetical protein
MTIENTNASKSRTPQMSVEPESLFQSLRCHASADKRPKDDRDKLCKLWAK